MGLVEDIVSAMTNPAIGVGEVENQDFAEKADRMQRTFTTGVHFLRAIFPSPTVNDLMAYVWDVVGKKHVPCGVGPEVPTITIASIVSKTNGMRNMILIPHDWLEKVEQNCVYQLGAMVFVGSQATDLFNERLGDVASGDLVRRARAYESEFLHTVQKTVPEFVPNDYQKSVMSDFPNGLPRDLVYTRKPIYGKN